MLRGRRFCAISDRPTPSPFASSSLFPPLTPLFPLDASHSPVTPLFPLLTQKQGGTPLPWYDQSCQFGITSNSIFSRCSPSRRPTLLRALSVRRLSRSGRDGESLFSSGDSVPNFRIPAKNTETAYITVPLSIIILNIVGAPTFLRLHASARLQEQSPSPTRSGQAPGGPFQPSTGHPAKDAHPERGHCGRRVEGSLRSFSPNPNHSRTSRRSACKSNHSRTYAKTGGWGCHPQNAFARNSCVFFDGVNHIVIYMIIYIVGAPTLSFLRAVCKSQKRRGETQDHRQECLCHRKEEPKSQVKNRTWGTRLEMTD